MRKALCIVLLMTLMFLLPSDGSAQAVPSPGDRIRIKQVDGTVLTGTLAALSPETIQLSVDSSRVEVPVARIEVLETSLGQQRRFRKYIGLTVATTSILGAAYGAITFEPCESLCFLFPTTADSRSFLIFAGFLGGAIIGVPVGVILGSVLTEERWIPVALPALAELGLSIRPVIGSGVGFAASVRVGGL